MKVSIVPGQITPSKVRMELPYPRYYTATQPCSVLKLPNLELAINVIRICISAASRHRKHGDSTTLDSGFQSITLCAFKYE